jgi:hypothetical protein
VRRASRSTLAPPHQLLNLRDAIPAAADARRRIVEFVDQVLADDPLATWFEGWWRRPSAAPIDASPLRVAPVTGVRTVEAWNHVA